MVSTFVIGDIHGCFTELCDLLEAAALTSDDHILAVGDLVDRGPDPMGVLRFFRTYAHAATVAGNHERKHVRARDGRGRLAQSQVLTREACGDAYGDAVDYMAVLPVLADVAGAIVTHAFWEPGVARDDQPDNVLTGTLAAERYLLARYGGPWYELYDGPAPLIVGHHDYLRTGQPLVCRDRVFAIDTGCCYGLALTGLLVPEFRFVSVRSRANYWSRSGVGPPSHPAAVAEPRQRDQESPASTERPGIGYPGRNA
jgi:serine/threonine protein phosphatase 1